MVGHAGVMLKSAAGSATSHPAPRPWPDLVLVGGVPGAGKSTAIRRATADLVGVLALDPEQLQIRIRDLLPTAVPYRSYRSLVHVLHTARVFARLLRGPGSGPRLVVHDPGTRIRRRRLFLALARARGWRTTLVYIDVDRAAARSGQWERGRVLDASVFDRHWSRWQQLRSRLTGAENPEPTCVGSVILVDRDQAAGALRRLCSDQHRTDQPSRSANNAAFRSPEANDAVIELRANRTRSSSGRAIRSTTAA